jgi:ABC-2 type transport system ATP-binding protein
VGRRRAVVTPGHVEGGASGHGPHGDCARTGQRHGDGSAAGVDGLAERHGAAGAVVVDGLTKRYRDVTALEGVSFAAARGEALALLGPNGAGKTTAVEILEGFLAPSAGTVRVLGADPRRGGREWRARVGIVSQATSLDERLTVHEVLRAFAAVFPGALAVEDALALTDLREEARTRVGRLSGGQRRRVDLALGIVGRPDVLFLDEPTTGLDPAARRRTWAVIDRLRESGVTVLLTTHYMEEAERLADRLLVLARGRLVADASPAELRARSTPATIRCPLPAALAAGLPPALAAHLQAGELVIRTRRPADALERLLAWSRAAGHDLAGLEVGPASLEDAYLALTHA